MVSENEPPPSQPKRLSTLSDSEMLTRSEVDSLRQWASDVIVSKQKEFKKLRE